MFTIIYANGVRVFDIVTKAKLHAYVTSAESDITDIYEQATPITKQVRRELQPALGMAQTTAAARRFLSSPR